MNELLCDAWDKKPLYRVGIRKGKLYANVIPPLRCWPYEYYFKIEGGVLYLVIEDLATGKIEPIELYRAEKPTLINIAIPPEELKDILLYGDHTRIADRLKDAIITRDFEIIKEHEDFTEIKIDENEYALINAGIYFIIEKPLYYLTDGAAKRVENKIKKLI